MDWLPLLLVYLRFIRGGRLIRFPVGNTLITSQGVVSRVHIIFPNASINPRRTLTIRLATSRPLGERSEPFLAAKRPTASDEVARGASYEIPAKFVRAIRNPTKDFFESLANHEPIAT